MTMRPPSGPTGRIERRAKERPPATEESWFGAFGVSGETTPADTLDSPESR
jgi:hypothetical protein